MREQNMKRKDYVTIGKQLGYLTKEDEDFILDKNNSMEAVQERLISARKRSITEELDTNSRIYINKAKKERLRAANEPICKKIM